MENIRRFKEFVDLEFRTRISCLGVEFHFKDADTGAGLGSGYGNIDGNGYSGGSSDGSGSGSDKGFGYGHGGGSGVGTSNGCGASRSHYRILRNIDGSFLGSFSVDSTSFGNGDISGSGHGEGFFLFQGVPDIGGIKSINGKAVYLDRYIIDTIHRNVAKCRVLHSDWTMSPEYYFKFNGVCAWRQTSPFILRKHKTKTRSFLCPKSCGF